jgi:hypothetical protein
MNTANRLKKYFETDLVKTAGLDQYLITDIISMTPTDFSRLETLSLDESIDLLKSLSKSGITLDSEFRTKGLSELESKKILLDLEKSKLKNQESFFTQHKDLMKTYPLMDLSFLQLSKRTDIYLPVSLDTKISVNMPLFMFYTLDSQKPKIFLKRYFTDNKTAGFSLSIDGLSLFKKHKAMLETWSKAVKSTAKKIDFEETTYESTQIWTAPFESYQIKAPDFTSMIPPDVKKEITEARKFFGEQIYIVPYVKKWCAQNFQVSFISKKEPQIIHTPMDDDPLVIGGTADQINKGYGFLIASFDPTPIEDYIKQAYIDGKPLRN